MADISLPGAEDDAYLYFDLVRKADSTVKFLRFVFSVLGCTCRKKVFSSRSQFDASFIPPSFLLCSDGTKIVVNTHTETVCGYGTEDGDIPCITGVPNIHYTRNFVEEIVYRPDLPEAHEVVTKRKESMIVPRSKSAAPSLTSQLSLTSELSFVSVPSSYESSYTSMASPDAQSAKIPSEEMLQTRQFLNVVEFIEPASQESETENHEAVESWKEPEVEIFTKTRLVIEKFA